MYCTHANSPNLNDCSVDIEKKYALGGKGLTTGDSTLKTYDLRLLAPTLFESLVKTPRKIATENKSPRPCKSQWMLLKVMINGINCMTRLLSKTRESLRSSVSRFEYAIPHATSHLVIR